MLFGRHQLIKLSPKKTVEGFVGAFFVTILFAIFVRLSTLLIFFSFLLSNTDADQNVIAVGNFIHAIQLYDLSSTGLSHECAE